MSVEYNLDGDVAVITLNRPNRFNAIEATLSTGMVEALGQAGDHARAAVITGEGKAFCSGADLADLESEYETGGPDLAAHLETVFHPVVQALVDCRVPTVAAINGVAAGAGMGLALACDMRVIAESAFLTSAFTAIGLTPDSGTTWWLPQMVGVSRALEITLTNRRISAEEAVQIGLCVAVAPDESVIDEALSIARSLADLVPDSLVTTRRLIRTAAGRSFTEALSAEQTEQGRLGKTPEHAEGVRAFLEKRKANFRGAT
jgi:2-(1,2-epoxy-1,2-dihydrophenyl)acetyl-CoA isomerase